MNMLQKTIALNVNTTVHLTTLAVCNLMAVLFADPDHPLLGDWCTKVSAKYPHEGEELWRVIPCGGTLEIELQDGEKALLEFENLANGFAQWYEEEGHEIIPLNLNAKRELCFAPYCTDVPRLQKSLDMIIQYALFGYYRFTKSECDKTPTVVAEPVQATVHTGSAVNCKATANEVSTSVTVHNPDTPFTYTGKTEIAGRTAAAPKNYRCDKCAKERSCTNRRPDCGEYVREAKDGGYYG